jgi:uncharacterized protein (DUF433 family)
VYLDTVDGLLKVSTDAGRQYAIPEVSKGLQRIERVDGFANRLFPFAKNADEPRYVAIDPRRSFGRPTIDGSGVAVAVIADLVKAGETAAAVAKEFGIEVAAVRGAVAWHKLAAA